MPASAGMTMPQYQASIYVYHTTQLQRKYSSAQECDATMLNSIPIG
jgi:hypothetical protein